MKLRDIYRENCKKINYIGIFKDKGTKIQPEYADEMLETHGDCTVIDYKIYGSILVVELKEV